MSGKKEYFEAIRSGNLPAVSALLDADPELLNSRNDQGQTGVLLAAYSGRKEILDALVARGADLEIHEAAAAGQLARAKQLVERNPSLARSFSPDGFPVLALAAVFGHEDVARFLQAKGGDVNSVSSNPARYTALTGAVASGHASIVKWLISSGADVNYRYGQGYSPLLTAAANGHLEIVKMLLDGGADPRATTDDGKSAAQLAVERGHSQVADFLRARG